MNRFSLSIKKTNFQLRVRRKDFVLLLIVFYYVVSFFYADRNFYITCLPSVWFILTFFCRIGDKFNGFLFIWESLYFSFTFFFFFFFPLLLLKEIFAGYRILGWFFSPSILNISFHSLCLCDFWKKSNVILILVPLNVRWLFLLPSFSVFSLPVIY